MCLTDIYKDPPKKSGAQNSFWSEKRIMLIQVKA